MAQQTLRIRPDLVPLFLAAVIHNYAVLADQIKARRFCDQDYYFVTVIDGELHLVPPGSHDADIVRASNDYIAGAFVGALPFIGLHGSDGVKIDECGNVREVELKLCMKSSLRYEINTKGSIQVIDGTGGFRSDCGAHYEIVNNLGSKNVDTYLVVFEKKLWKLIDIYRMSGEKIIELLGKNQSSGEDKTSKKRSITLSAFMKSGQKVWQDKFEAITVLQFEADIYARCGRDPAEAQIWNTEKNEQFKILWSDGVSLDELKKVFPGRTTKALQSHAKKLKVKRPHNQ